MGYGKVIKKYVRNFINDFRYNLESIKDQDEINYSKNIELQSLTDSEIYDINRKWAGVTPRLKNGYLGLRIYKTLHGFNPNYVPINYFYPFITKSLNDSDAITAFSHKGMMPIYFNGIRQPSIIINCIRGTLLDKEFHPISLQSAIETIKNIHKDLIIKPSTDTSSGKNVRIIKLETNRKELENIIRSYGNNFVIQEIINQSEETKRFNPTSLQTLRINTLLLNNHLSVGRTIMRVGGANSIVDNLNAGGFMVDIKPNGQISEYGYSLDGKKHSSSNGYILKDYMIPNFDKVLNLAMEAHLRIPQCKLVGWDISLDEKNEPILIEANLRNPSAVGVQLCGGPFFGSRTDEVIDFVRRNRDKRKIFSRI